MVRLAGSDCVVGMFMMGLQSDAGRYPQQHYQRIAAHFTLACRKSWRAPPRVA